MLKQKKMYVICIKQKIMVSTECQMLTLKRYVFNLFLKSLVSDTVRKSVEREREREFHDAGPKKRTWCAAEV